MQPTLTQDAFNKLQEYANHSGQVLNKKKTILLPISERIDHPKFYITTQEGDIIRESKECKFLGINLTTKPNLNHHNEKTMVKAKQRIWILRNLKRAGVNAKDLSAVYIAMIRSLFDYCAQVHSVMSGSTMKSRMEAVQTKALRVIHGFDIGREEMRLRSNITTLEEHHRKMTIKFVEKALDNERFKHWFPQRENPYLGILRTPKLIEETNAKSQRLYTAPIYAYRRIANELLHQKQLHV